MTYQLIIPNDLQLRSLMRKWLILALTSLAIAGIFSFLPVALRVPGVQNIIPWKDFYKTSLIIHVNLSVLMWLLSFSAILWGSVIKSNYFAIAKYAQYVASVGILLVAVSPFTGEGKPLLNNYVPILQNFVFFLGLALFSCGICIQSVLCLSSCNYKALYNDPIQGGIFSSAVISLVAFICILISDHDLTKLSANEIIDVEHYYEMLFWSGGHVLQFNYVILMQILWLCMAGKVPCNSSRFLSILMLVNVLFVIYLPYIHLKYHIDSVEFRYFFTRHMRELGGVTSIIIGLMILYGLIRDRKIGLINNYIASFLLISILLFFSGGIIGILIMGTNVTIPAHYHGSIVGVTLSLMGGAYLLFMHLNIGNPKGWQVSIQPYLYGLGQLLHISALAWCGGYGALRKTPGVTPNLEVKIGMIVMGVGGVFAILGGLLFVVVMFKTIITKRENVNLVN